MWIKISLLTGVFLVVFLVGAEDPARLSEEENGERKKTCGTSFNYKESDAGVEISGAQQLAIVLGKNESKSLGSFISKRHILTNAQMILSQNEKNETTWMSDGKLFEAKECTNPNYPEFHIEIPAEHIKDVRIIYGRCPDNICSYEEATPKRAYLLLTCYYKSLISSWSTPLLLEMDSSFNHPTSFCINDEFRKSDKHSEEVEIFEMSNGTLSLRKNVIKSKGMKLHILRVNKYYSKDGRGSVMVKLFNGRYAILGIGATPAMVDEPETFTNFYDVWRFDKPICEATGICNTNATVAPTTVFSTAVVLNTTVAPTVTVDNSTTVAPRVTVDNSTTVATEVTEKQATTVASRTVTVASSTIPPKTIKPREPPRIPKAEIESREETLDGAKQEPKEQDYVERELDYLDDLFVAPEFLKSATRRRILMVLISQLVLILMIK